MPVLYNDPGPGEAFCFLAHGEPQSGILTRVNIEAPIDCGCDCRSTWPVCLAETTNANMNTLGTSPGETVVVIPRAVLIEQLFSQIFLFFYKKNEYTQEKAVNISKVWQFNRRQIFGRLRIPIFGFVLFENKIKK